MRGRCCLLAGKGIFLELCAGGGEDVRLVRLVRSLFLQSSSDPVVVLLEWRVLTLGQGQIDLLSLAL